MDTSGLKSFAQEARKKLRQQIGTRLDYWLGSDSAEHRQFAGQIKELKAALAKEGRDALVERVAYTWFNRLAALRFLDANGYHLFGIRVVTPASKDEVMPELLQQARAGVLDAGLRKELSSSETFDRLIDGRMQIENAQGEAYRMLLFAVCHYYHRLMPFLFERLGDATELLLPEDLLTEHSIVSDFREALEDDDCREVEVIGWLYQFYISEKKDEVMARKTAVKKEDIPAVTQLFTPHWIVRYLVENSLGRLWLLNRPRSRLRDKMPYYIESDREADFLKIAKPEEIRMLDPAAGSGHMLTYAYDLLYAIYEEEGYDALEIPGLILKNNLCGVEICDRAATLAAFALCMKARGSDKHFFRRVVQPNVISLQDVRFEEGELQEYIRALNLGDLFSQPMLKLLYQFEEAKNFGSLIKPCIDDQGIGDTRHAIEAKDLGGQLFLRETHAKVLRVLEQSEYLSQRYHVVIANPPYMGSGAMNPALKVFAKNSFPKAKADMFAMFMVRSVEFILPLGYIGMINLPSWLFLSTFEELRKYIIDGLAIESLLHMGRGIFGIDWGSTAFILKKVYNPHKSGAFFRLHKRNFQHIYFDDIGTLYLNAKNDHNYRYDFEKYRGENGVCEISSESDRNGLIVYYEIATSEFKKIPGSPIAYWASPAVRQLFAESKGIDQIAPVKHGMSTGCNAKFLRLWHEIATSRLGLNFANRAAAEESNFKWFPYNKGGNFRKWYGNNEFVVDYFRGGEAMVAGFKDGTNRGFRHDGKEYYFRPGVTWSFISSSSFGVRYAEVGSVFDVAGSSAFPAVSEVKAVTAYLCSILAFHFMQILNPTFNFQVGNVATLPWNPEKLSSHMWSIASIAEEAIEMAKADWDNFETSWDFRDQPLLRSGLKGATLGESWDNWRIQCDAAIRRMQEQETENNRLFIAAYGLQDELAPEVPEDQITLARPDKYKDATALVSYAVGCMMGRYSLDKPGLILADAGATLKDFLSKVPNHIFTPDADGILPILDGEWFPDDVIARTREFIKVAWGEKHLASNIGWLEEALGRDLRNYFVRDFYKNHLSNERTCGYKKRPIYWLVASPQGSFQALIYLHRYTRDTVNLLLDQYVREFVHKLEARAKLLASTTIDESARSSERTAATRERDKLQKMIREIQAWDRDVVLPLAQQRIELDLDDGVKTNYLKFPGLLAKIPGLEKKEED